TSLGTVERSPTQSRWLWCDWGRIRVWDSYGDSFRVFVFSWPTVFDMTMRVLILATTTGYQTRAFGEAAERLGVELVFATDRCHLIEDPWQDGAIAIRFYDEEASVAAILAAAADRPLDGILVVGDRPTVIAARVADALGLPWHPAAAAATACHKPRTPERLPDAGLPVPW